MTVAYIGRDRQLHLLDAAGRSRALTGLAWGGWGESTDAATHSWPTWSPDGRRLACFRLEGDARPVGDDGTEEKNGVRVRVLDVRGVDDADLVDLGDRLPIYLQWAPKGDAVAVLSQERAVLHLTVARPDRLGVETRLASGSPLFFTWAGDALAAYVGTDRGAEGRVELLDPKGHSRTVLPGFPGNFCAPIWLGERVLYVVLDGEESVVVTAAPGDASPSEIERVEGLVALCLSPDGRHVARAIAADGDGTPYRDLTVLDVRTGEVRKLVADGILAFLWAGSDALVTVQVDTSKNLLRWTKVELDGTRVPLVDSHPTRDLGFYLRFFEQYSQSHALVDPRGGGLLVAGSLPGQGDPQGKSRIFRVALDGAGIEVLAEGVFAVWSPEGR